MQKITTHREQSRIFLAQAYEELAKGDLPQASEKGWGAAAQMLKATAQQRGWRNSTHRDLYLVSRALRRETGDKELTVLYSAASSLHVNFYEIEYASDTIEDLLQQVERLVGQAGGVARRACLTLQHLRLQPKGRYAPLSSLPLYPPASTIAPWSRRRNLSPRRQAPCPEGHFRTL